MFILYCKTLLLLLRWDTGKIRDMFGGMGRFKGGLRCKGWVSSVIINVITESNYMQVFFKAAVHNFACKMYNIYIISEYTIFQTMFLAFPESLRYTYNKCLYSDYFRLVRVGTAAEYFRENFTCVIHHRQTDMEK